MDPGYPALCPILSWYKWLDRPSLSSCVSHVFTVSSAWVSSSSHTSVVSVTLWCAVVLGSAFRASVSPGCVVGWCPPHGHCCHQTVVASPPCDLWGTGDTAWAVGTGDTAWAVTGLHAQSQVTGSVYMLGQLVVPEHYWISGKLLHFYPKSHCSITNLNRYCCYFLQIIYPNIWPEISYGHRLLQFFRIPMYVYCKYLCSNISVHNTSLSLFFRLFPGRIFTSTFVLTYDIKQTVTCISCTVRRINTKSVGQVSISTCNVTFIRMRSLLLDNVVQHNTAKVLFIYRW